LSLTTVMQDSEAQCELVRFTVYYYAIFVVRLTNNADEVLLRLRQLVLCYKSTDDKGRYKHGHTMFVESSDRRCTSCSFEFSRSLLLRFAIC